MALGLAAAWVMPFEGLGAVLLVAGAAQVAAVPFGSYSVPVAVLVAALLLVRALARADRLRLEGAEIAAVAFVGLLAVTSVLHAGDPTAALRVCALVAAGVGAFIGLSIGVTDHRAAISGLRWLLFVIVGNALIGIAAVGAHLLAGSFWGVRVLEQPEGFPAAAGVAFEPNLFGSTCAIGAVLLLGLWRVRNPVIEARSAIIGFWLCAAGLVLSMTRGAWIGFAVGAVAVVLLTRRDVGKRNVGRLFLGGAALLVSALALAFVVGQGPAATGLVRDASTAIGEQGGRTFEFDRGTGYLRAAEWQMALEDARSSPLFGLGANTYGERHSVITLDGVIPAYLGNWVVRTLHDAGIVGFVLLAGIFASMVWPGRQVRTRVGEEAAVVRILCAAGLTMIVAYLAADAFLLVWPWAVLGIFRSYRRTIPVAAAS